MDVRVILMILISLCTKHVVYISGHSFVISVDEDDLTNNIPKDNFKAGYGKILTSVRSKLIISRSDQTSDIRVTESVNYVVKVSLLSFLSIPTWKITFAKAIFKHTLLNIYRYQSAMQIMIDHMRQSHAFHSQFPAIIRKMSWCIVLIFISNVTAIKHAVSYPRWWAMDAVHCPMRSAALMVCANIKSKSI